MKIKEIGPIGARTSLVRPLDPSMIIVIELLVSAKETILLRGKTAWTKMC